MEAGAIRATAVVVQHDRRALIYLPTLLFPLFPYYHLQHHTRQPLAQRFHSSVGASF